MLTNAAGEVLLKIVVVSYEGAGRFIEGVRNEVQPTRLNDNFRVEDNDGWCLTAFNYVHPSARIQERPVRVYLFGHEGMGFVGQPGSAKDVVYKHAHALIGVAAGQEELKDLMGVVDADLTRMRSQGHSPVCVLATPQLCQTQALPLSGSPATWIAAPWRTSPLDVLAPTLQQVLTTIAR